jgi:hypothetical protein
VYQRYRCDNTGAVTDSSLYTRSVVRDTTISNSTWYILSDKSLVQNSQQGYVHYHTSMAPVVLYPNAEFGGSPGYNYVYPSYTVWVLTYRDASPAPVPKSRQPRTATRYRIEMQYLYNGQTTPVIQNREEFVSPEQGLVRADTYWPGSNFLQQRLELQTFTPK